MADTQVVRSTSGAVPGTYVLPDAAEFLLKCVNADFNGAAAGGDWLPCVEIRSDANIVIARAVSQDVKVTAGDDAEVSWFRGVKPRSSAVAGPRCKLLGKGNGTDTITITLDAAVPADGVLQVVLMQATIGDSFDTASAPNAASDSQGVAGWAIPHAGMSEPLIGPIREDISGSGPPTTSQALSVTRACTTGDLGIGDTITVTYTTADPGLFHTCGLVVWQRAFFETIRQFGSREYANGDDHPGSGASLTRLSWDDDFGPGSAIPDRDALVITGMGAYPAVAGFAPFVGSVIGEIATGSVSVAAVCYEASVGVAFDPGGTWPTPAIQLVGNYQTVYPRTFSGVIP